LFRLIERLFVSKRFSCSGKKKNKFYEHKTLVYYTHTKSHVVKLVGGQKYGKPIIRLSQSAVEEGLTVIRN
jgi:hypothetical protein